jgi:glycosyltransferase involved in cell wall biosynthesis
MTPIRVLELRSVWGTGGGPDKTILSGAALKSRNGVETIVCYIRDARDQVFTIDQRAKKLGIDYVEVIERHSFDRGIWPQLRALIEARAIDIVHAHDHKTDFLTWLLGMRTPIVPLSTAHGFAGDSRNEQIYYAVEKRLLARFPRVIAVSNPIRDELVRTGSRSDRVTVINNGIDHHVFVRRRERERDVRTALGYGPDDVVIGAVGRLESEKRFDLLVEAFATVVKTFPRARLAIVGEGTHRASLEAAIDRLGLAATCRLLGHHGDVVTLHHAFDLLVQSSIREGTPNAVLEAMALETPIVATDVGGTRELVTDGVHGLLVTSGTAEALVDGMIRALTDRAVAVQRATAARTRVETELSFERRVQKVEAVYQDLMARRSPARHQTRDATGVLPQDQQHYR